MPKDYYCFMQLNENRVFTTFISLSRSAFFDHKCLERENRKICVSISQQKVLLNVPENNANENVVNFRLKSTGRTKFFFLPLYLHIMVPVTVAS